jgi:hypothetical protein
MLTPQELARAVLIETSPPTLYDLTYAPDPGPWHIPFTSMHDHYLAYGADWELSRQMLERMVVHVREHGHAGPLMLIGHSFEPWYHGLEEYGITTLESDAWPTAYYCVTAQIDQSPRDGEACVLLLNAPQSTWWDWDGVNL